MCQRHSSVFTPSNNAHATTFTQATPSTVISDSGAVMLYLRLDCGPIAFDELAESGLAARLSHFGCVIRGPDGLKVGNAPWNVNILGSAGPPDEAY